MITSLTPDQANFIAGILATLKGMYPYRADGFSISVNLHDELFDGHVGEFTQEEGAWLFNFIELPRPKMFTLDEVAQATYNENPGYYRDRKIAHIKDARQKWADLTGTHSSLVDTKRAVENIIQDVALAELRARLTTPSFPDPEEPLWNDEDEDRAHAEHRERLAEQGTWFGAPGPLDEEPF
jgi:hypothetical protein